MEGPCEERRSEVAESVDTLERGINQAGELMQEIIARLEAVLSPDAPEPVNPETAKALSQSFSVPLAQHMTALSTQLGNTINAGEKLLRRIEV